MNLEWIIVACSALAGGVGAYIGSYLRQKGQNLATREDLAQITQVQESIRSKLAVQVHFGRLRYEREFEVYREVWRAVRKFYSESIMSGQWPEPSSGSGSAAPTKTSWLESWRELDRVVEDNKPFYPNELWRELSEFTECSRRMAWSYRNREAAPAERQSDQEHAKAKYACVEDAIRRRLAKFDDEISVMQDLK